MGGSGPDTTLATANDFRNYYTDLSVPGRWHRMNMFGPSWKEVGSAVMNGTYQGWPGFITVLDFAYSGTTSFLTGVAYSDTSHDNFYTPGEQMTGVQVKAIRNSDGATYSTTTWDSGGYSLALPPGTYTVWGSGGPFGPHNAVRYDNVTIGDQNVKRDFRPDYVNAQINPPAGKPVRAMGNPNVAVMPILVPIGTIDLTTGTGLRAANTAAPILSPSFPTGSVLVSLGQTTNNGVQDLNGGFGVLDLI
jgi:hypothetical protein